MYIDQYLAAGRREAVHLPELRSLRKGVPLIEISEHLADYISLNFSSTAFQVHVSLAAVEGSLKIL